MHELLQGESLSSTSLNVKGLFGLELYKQTECDGCSEMSRSAQVYISLYLLMTTFSADSV